MLSVLLEKIASIEDLKEHGIDLIEMFSSQDLGRELNAYINLNNMGNCVIWSNIFGFPITITPKLYC